MENKYLSLHVDSLQNNFKHFSLKFQSSDELEHAQTVLQEELSEQLELNSGKVLRIRRLSKNELLVYLVTRPEDDKDWRSFILQTLIKFKCKFNGASHMSLSNTCKA